MCSFCAEKYCICDTACMNIKNWATILYMSDKNNS